MILRGLLSTLRMTAALAADAARLGHRLEPHRHVDIVAENIAVFLDHITEIDTHAEA